MTELQFAMWIISTQLFGIGLGVYATAHLIRASPWSKSKSYFASIGLLLASIIPILFV